MFSFSEFCGDPIDSADDLRPSTTSKSVENFDRVYGCSRRDTDYSAAVVLSGDSTGDVRAVAVVVIGLRVAFNAARSVDHVEIRMGKGHARVDHCHANATWLVTRELEVCPGTLCGRGGFDPECAGRHGFVGDGGLGGAIAWASPSGLMNATSGSFAIFSRIGRGSIAAKPLIACWYLKSLLNPWRRSRSAVFAGTSILFLYATMNESGGAATEVGGAENMSTPAKATTAPAARVNFSNSNLSTGLWVQAEDGRASDRLQLIAGL